MAFELRVYTSKSFLLKLDEFKLRSIYEFEGDIDIESYLFFKTIIYQKAPRIILDLTQDEIIAYKEMSQQEVTGNVNEDIIKIIKAPTGKHFYSDDGLIHKLRLKEDVPHEKLPHYLFLDTDSEEICREIENCYGIVCFSLNRLKVPENIRKVSLVKLKNTKQAIYSKVNENIFNSIHIIDPYFFSKAFVIERRREFNADFLVRPKKYKAELKVKLTTNLKDRTENELKEWEQNFNSELNIVQRNSSFRVTLGRAFDGSNHDRYIFTNIHINIVGNSFFQNGETHFTSYPIGIYGNFFD